MAKHALLNNVDHRELRVQTGYGAEFGDDTMCTLAIPSEFRHLQADYPILIHRNADTGQCLPMVMFSFQEGENLYLDGRQWQASYIPLMMRRGPFLIGFQTSGKDPGAGRNMVVSIDMDNPRVGVVGEPLFQPFGGNSEYLDRIVDVLQEIDRGQAAIAELGHALVQHDLIEPLSLAVTLNNGDKYCLSGFHVIHEERLASLDGEVLADFSQRGILQAAYMMIASLAQIPALIAMKNRRA
jgi:hypothetical protein